MSTSSRGSRDSKKGGSLADPRRRENGSASLASGNGSSDRQDPQDPVLPGSQPRSLSAPLVSKELPSHLKTDKRQSSKLKKATARDSLEKDRFFRAYDTPDSRWLSQQLKTERPPIPSKQLSTTSQNPSEELIGVASTSSDPPETGTEQWGPSSGHSYEINIGILGIGASTFVERACKVDGDVPAALGLDAVVFEGDTYSVALVEISLDDLATVKAQTEEEPTAESGLPHIDGIVAFYNTLDALCLSQVSDVIDTLQDAVLPTVFASPELNNPPNIAVANNLFIEMKANKVLRDVNVIQTSEHASESQKHSISLLTQEIVQSSFERRSQKSTNVSSRSAKPAPGVVEGDAISQHSSTATEQAARSRPDAADGASGRGSFLDDDDNHDDDASSKDFRTDSETSSRTRLHHSSHVPHAIAVKHACSFQELVQHLCTPSSSQAYAQFVFTFLALYRAFAAPFTLLEALISPFSTPIRPEEEPEAAIRLDIIDKWITAYRGDFYRSMTRFRLEGFLADTQRLPNLRPILERVSFALDTVMLTDDTDWAFNDAALGKPGVLSPTGRSFLNVFAEDRVDDDPPTSSSSSSSRRKPDGSTTSVDANVNASGRAISALNSFIPTTTAPPRTPTTVPAPTEVAEPAQRQARLLRPNPTTSLGKVKWRLFMAQPDEEVARELTRMDWIMFTSIRPRDLVRHVTVPSNEASNFKGLENVYRMVDHFNHIAFWVTNIVLLRDKAKNRAEVLEKLMRVARKVRQLNNYNALGALVAGIQGNAIYRLTQTRTLISAEVQTDFKKLEMLVSAQRGHSAYRMAWENTRTERIPFLPLHRRDLVAAEVGNKTLLRTDAAPGAEPKINWRKFEIMGDILLDISRAQVYAYTGFAENASVKALVLDCRIAKDEDELWAWSLALEPAVGGAPPKKGSWMGKGGGGGSDDGSRLAQSKRSMSGVKTSMAIPRGFDLW